jgi:hypothetical protein
MKILIEIQQDFDESELTKKESLIARNPSSNPTIRKYQLNPIIRKESEENPVIKKFSKEKINPIIMKNLQVNPAIRKHQVQTPLSGSAKFKPRYREVSCQPCNQKPYNQDFQTPLSGSIRSTMQLKSTMFSNPTIGKF